MVIDKSDPEIPAVVLTGPYLERNCLMKVLIQLAILVVGPAFKLSGVLPWQTITRSHVLPSRERSTLEPEGESNQMRTLQLAMTVAQKTI